MKPYPFFAASFGLLLTIFTAATSAETGNSTSVNPGEIKWQDAPSALPRGGKVAVLYGDPHRPGPFVMRLTAPAGYRIPPHWHSQSENLTVISGTLYLGSGDKVDSAHTHALKPGGFHHLPAKAHHYAYAKTPTVVQVHGQEPFDINYIDPADDPQKTRN